MNTHFLNRIILFALLLCNTAAVMAAKSVYIPKDWTRQTDGTYKEGASGLTWSMDRAVQSDNAIVMWDSRYGSTAPNKLSTSSSYYVDVNTLLAKVEEFYTLECAKLGFWNGDASPYKVMVLLNYDSGWICTGAGYDFTVPAIWLSPSTCKPVGSAVAHEVGHAFHYMCYSVASNYGQSSTVQTGFHSTWSTASNGQAIWETTANWQALQSYPDEFFTESGMADVFAMSHNYAFSHEWHRYQAYPFLYYLCEKYNDITTVANVWNHPETSSKDFNQVLMDNKRLSDADLYRMYFEFAQKCAVWDFSNVSTSKSSYIGNFNYHCVQLTDGSYQVAYASCPQSTGFNLIPLTASAGTTVSVDFTALVPGCNLVETTGMAKYMNEETIYTTTSATKYNTNSYASRRGFRLGFVAYLRDGSHQYFGEDQVYCTGNGESTATVGFTVPTNATKLWMVVVPAPSTYIRHDWDESISNDDQWPYKFKLSNASLSSKAVVTAQGSSGDSNLLTFPFSLDREVGMAYTADEIDISSQLQDAVSFLGCSSVSDATVYFINKTDGSKVSDAMATYDGWASNVGDATTWGNDSYVCVKFTPTATNKIIVCTFPGLDTNVGDSYSATWALVYGGKQVNFETYVNLVAPPVVSMNDYTIVGTYNYSLTTALKEDYSTTSVSIAADEIAQALGISSLSQATFCVSTNDGTFSSTVNAGARGAWIGENGKRCEWADATSRFFVDTDFANLLIGQYPGKCESGQQFQTVLYFLYNNKLAKIILSYDIELDATLSNLTLLIQRAMQGNATLEDIKTMIDRLMEE